MIHPRTASGRCIWLSALFCTLAAFFCHLPYSYADNRPAVKVGLLLSLSGGLEQWCSYIRQGVELAVSEGGPVRIEVIYEDDHSIDRKLTLSAAQKLVYVDNVDVLVSWTASTVPVLSALANAAHTPYLTGAYDRNVARGGPYVFGAFVNYELVPREIARFFTEQLKARRLALVMAADDWSQSFEAPFREEAQKLGAEMVLSETVSPDEEDTRALILKLKQKQVDAVLAPLYAGSLYSFLKNARELHFSGALHVGDGMFEEDIRIAGASAEGVYAAQIWLESPALRLALEKRFGRSSNPLQLGMAASGYDWVRHLEGVVLEIVKEGRAVSREALRDKLSGFRSRGYLGDLMYGDAPVQSGEITVVVREGRYVPWGSNE